MNRVTLAFAAALAATPLAVSGNEFSAELNALAESELRAWVTDSTIVEAIRSQNAANSGMAQAAIDEMDQTWRAQVGASDSPLIDEVMGRPASASLRDRKNGMGGLITEVFVMDAQGLNVAQSDVTSDYWQGDEAKWQETYNTGNVHIGDVELDESTQTYQAQISLPIFDPESNAVIGAATFGVNLELLQ